MKIVINGVERELVVATLSYADIVRHVTGKAPGETPLTVTACSPKTETGWALIPGQGVTLEPGLVINAVVTGAA